LQHTAGLSRDSFTLDVSPIDGTPTFASSCDGQMEALASSSTALALNRWTHVAGVFDPASSAIILYVDGKSVGQDVSTCSHVYVSGASLQVGEIGLRGLISEVRMSSGVRYTAAFTPATKLAVDASTIALYHFADGSGSTARDSASNPADLTLSGASLASSCP
jgi:hypothetical protein